MRAFSSTLIAELREEVFTTFWLVELEFSTIQRFVDIDIDITSKTTKITEVELESYEDISIKIEDDEWPYK